MCILPFSQLKKMKGKQYKAANELGCFCLSQNPQYPPLNKGDANKINGNFFIFYRFPTNFSVKQADLIYNYFICVNKLA